jgi:hypothetical protein
VTINQSLGSILCRFIVGTIAQDFRAKEMAVSTDDVSAIVRHGGSLDQAGARNSQSPMNAGDGAVI